MAYLYTMPGTGRLAVRHAIFLNGNTNEPNVGLVARLPDGMLTEAGDPLEVIRFASERNPPYTSHVLTGSYPAGTQLRFEVIGESDYPFVDSGYDPVVEEAGDLQNSLILRWTPDMYSELTFIRPIVMPANGYVRITDTWYGDINWQRLEMVTPLQTLIPSNADPTLLGPFTAGTELSFIRTDPYRDNAIAQETYGEWAQTPSSSADVVISWAEEYYIQPIDGDAVYTTLHFLGEIPAAPAQLSMTATPRSGTAPLTVISSFTWTAPVVGGPAPD